MTDFAKTVDGVDIAFEVEGSGPPVVLIHGLGDDRTRWSPVVDLLHKTHSCVTLDLRGQGDSHGGTDFDALVLDRDVEAVVDRLGLDRPWVVGHSLGGFVATTYAARKPVGGAVNVDQPLHLAAFAGALRPLAPVLHSDKWRDVAMAILDAAGDQQLSPEARKVIRESRLRLKQEVVLGAWRTILEDDEATIERKVRAAIGGISAPYLSLFGNDPGPGYEAWLHESIPAAEVDLWAGLGHYPHLVDPKRFVQRLRAVMVG